ncbi:MAG TPA: hypothetical protein VMD53_08365 [Rhizomicrobium sp.]|nr:hypothetical protein [Rhizomicrobium sp.]
MLRAFLGTLPETVAVRLAKAVEMDRLADGKSLPHDLILDGLRPVLRRAGNVERTPSPLRLFCEPFSDLLTNRPRKEKTAGRIAHTSIPTVWGWLSKTLLPEETAQYSEAVKADILAFRIDNAHQRALEFWPLASSEILSALSSTSSATNKATRAALGGDAVIADAREMAIMLAVGSDIVELQRKLPSSAQALDDDILHALRATYDAVVDVMPDAAPFIAVVAMNRLARPWEALRLPLAISRTTQDTLISNTDMGLVGEILFADIEEHAIAVRSARQPEFDVDGLVAHIQAFAMLSSGLVKEVEMRRAGKWGQRLLKDRAALAEVMDAYMERAPREVLAALPTVKSGSFAGSPRVPDLRHAPDVEKKERALRYAQLISGCKDFAAQGSFGSSLAGAQEEVALVLQTYCDEMLRELKSATGERREIAEQFFTLAADLTGLLLSPEEGEFLRRRGRAALAQAAA